MAPLIAIVLLVLGMASPGIAACPTSVRFEPTAGGDLDAGWVGFVSDLPIFGTTLPLGLSCGASTPPCGTCTITGLAPGAGDRRLRCHDDTSRECSVATEVADCGAVDTCRYFASPPQSLGVGGIPLCLAMEVAGPVSGTVDVGSGAVATTLTLQSELFDGVFVDLSGGPNQGCPRCFDDPIPNDGLRGGICNAGPRVFLSCDAHGISPIPDFGSASFDCPPNDVDRVATLPLTNLTLATSAQSLALSVGSPACTGGSLPAGTRCFCGTCNTAAAEPCSDNADCPPSGGNPGVCNGRRCVGGANGGSPCMQNSECPGGGVCSRLGEPSKPNACHDDSTTPAVEACASGGDDRGACAAGPFDFYCANHPNRGCNDDDDCDAVTGACTIVERACWDDNGVVGATLSVTGAATPPVADVSFPTDLGALTCLPSTADPFTNAVWGLPGIARLHQSGRLTFDDSPPAATPTPTATPTPGVCPLAPAACRTPVTARKASLQLTDKSPDDKDQLGWKWLKGAATSIAELGNPLTVDDYALCLYDASGWRATMRVPAGTAWQQKSSGFVYRNRSAAPDGLTQLVLKAGVDGKAQLQAKGKGQPLPMPPLLGLAAPLQMQLRNTTTGLCWSATYHAFDKRTATQLKAKAD